MPSAVADWLGLKLPTGSDGVTWQLDSAWHWAPWATLLLVIVAIAWTAVLYARESSSVNRPYRVFLAALRLTALAILLVILAQWAIIVRITGPPAIAVVIDRSASMGIADQYDDTALAGRIKSQLSTSGLAEPSRINQAKSLLLHDDARWVNEVTARYRPDWYWLAGGVEHASSDLGEEKIAKAIREVKTDGAASNATRLGDGLKQVLTDFHGSPPAAIVVLTDGVVTEGVPLSDAADHARQRGVPLYTVGLGRDAPPSDIELADVLVEEVVFANDLVIFQAQVKASGLEGQAAKISLLRDGVTQPIAAQEIKLPASGQSLTVRLTDRPTKPGAIKYTVEIATRDDEINKANNRQQRTVTVRDDTLHILLAHGYPSYEFRFLKALLERDRSIKLSTFLQDADAAYAEQDKTALRSFPVDRNELFNFDVVIFGDLDPQLMPRSTWANLRAFATEKGGGMMFLAGPRFLPWRYQDNAELTALWPIDVQSLPRDRNLPAVVTNGFHVRPTALGLQNPALQLSDLPAENEQVWKELAPLFWLFPVTTLKPGAQVLAEGPVVPALSSDSPAFSAPQSATDNFQSAIPVICFQYVGAGRVEFLAIDSTWRWRIGAGDTYFSRFWVQTIRFLARGKLNQGRGAQLTSDRREYRRGETAQLRLRFLDERLAPVGDEAKAMIEAIGQGRRQVSLRRNSTAEGVFEAALPDLCDGQYEVLLVEPKIAGAPPAARFTVTAPPGEFARPEMDAASLRAAAEATHGKFYTFADADQLLADLPPGHRVPIENLPPIPIWNRWWLLLAFLSCLTTEWILRKRKGMM
jgi:hypothetical protein